MPGIDIETLRVTGVLNELAAKSVGGFVSLRNLRDKPWMERRARVCIVYDRAADDVGIYPREDAEVHDTMLDFAELRGVRDASGRHPGEWKWHRLTDAAAFIGYDWGDDAAHGSLADARATLAVQRWCDQRRTELNCTHGGEE